MIDITILTASKYLAPANPNWYEKQILEEDKLVKEALEANGLTVTRKAWDDTEFDWSSTRFALFRTIWDYFDRFDEFVPWLDKVDTLTTFINPLDVIRWNFDKHYLKDLSEKGINIPPTLFIEKGNQRSLDQIVTEAGWKEFVLKPAVSGAGRHTYRINSNTTKKHADLFNKLISREAMLIQEYQTSITTKGEIALMIFGDTYSHAVLKKAKEGEFRVQDDFGGTVHHHRATNEEIDFAFKVIDSCTNAPAYARVDLIRDNNNHLCLSELELIEPELWFRKHTEAATLFATKIIEYIS